jgi:hypothetical protein
MLAALLAPFDPDDMQTSAWGVEETDWPDNLQA